ncbi:MAG: hypothetical protein LBM18_06105 [Oscillospiraceae bacterium]|jgi:hypothetical protein|nr:hypothetical protein [Oscillospiraceae bacterium]
MDKKSEIEKGERIMPTAIKEAIDSEKRSLDKINSYLLKQIQLLEALDELPDNPQNNKKKIEMQKEIQAKLVRVGIITKNNNLKKNYK